MPLSDNDIKSELSYAYLHAVASRVGCECMVSGRHSDGWGVDARLFVKDRLAHDATLVRFTVEVQLKATSTPLTRVGNRYSFPLKLSHYNNLRATEVESPLLLIVFQMPANPDEWLRCSPQALTLKRCAYWVSLHGAPDSDNDDTQTVYLPVGNRFAVQTLRSLLDRFSREERIPYVP
jgi:hypothetical protein